MNRAFSAKHEQIIVALALGLVLAAMLALKPRVVTGDETRYVLYTMSIWLNGSLIMPLADWTAKSGSWLGYTMSEYPALAEGLVLGHPVYVGALLSPLAFFGMAGLRGAGLAAGLLGLWLVYRSARNVSGLIPSAIALITAGLTLPLAPYVFTYWIEVFIFLAISAGLLQLPHAGASLRSDFWRSIAILVIPFVHLRASVIGAVIFLLFCLRVIEAVGVNLRRLTPLVAAAACMAILLVGLNVYVYGGLTGSVNSARPPGLSDLLDVIATNIVSVKGVLPYAPIWLLGYAGLIGGVLRRERFVTECAVLAAIALLTSIGQNPGEGWPGRFLVASMPMLTIGFAYWTSRLSNVYQLLVTMLLGVLSTVNAVIFFIIPNIHIENRQADRVFAGLFNKIGIFNPGLFLPVEGIDISLGRMLVLVVVVLVLILAASLWVRQKAISLAALLIVLGFIDLTRVRQIPVSYVPSGRGITVTLPSSPRSAYVTFGPTWERWYSPPTYPRLDITIAGVGGDIGKTMPANPVIAVTCHRKIHQLKIESDDFNVQSAAASRLEAFEPVSLLMRLYVRSTRPCR